MKTLFGINPSPKFKADLVSITRLLSPDKITGSEE
jgi:hypothetical protein